jgi:release factor glutamine methyltransferase
MSEPRGAAEAWNVRKVLGWTAQHFEKKGIDSPRLTAEVLLAHVLKVDRVRLYTDLDKPLSAPELQGYRALIERRASGEPTAYLTGTKEFYARSFQVDARVLVPRPETELLAEGALRALPADAPSLALDLCTGSGCLAVTLAAERAQATVHAVDLSAAACEVARANAERHGVAARVTVFEGDLFAPLPLEARYQVIVSNPPYLRGRELATLSAEVRREPKLALDGGPEGLSVLERLIPAAFGRLVPGGLIALEIGEWQADSVSRLLTDAGFTEVRVDRDMARLIRLAYGRRP